LCSCYSVESWKMHANFHDSSFYLLQKILLVILLVAKNSTCYSTCSKNSSCSFYLLHCAGNPFMAWLTTKWWLLIFHSTTSPHLSLHHITSSASHWVTSHVIGSHPSPWSWLLIPLIGVSLAFNL
jgi:hypothetical protein